MRGLPTLRAFDRGEAQTERIEQVSDEYRRATMGTLRVAFLSGAVLELAATLGIALVAVTVGVRLVDGGLGFEAGLTVLVLAPELYLPLRNLAAQYHASADGLAVAERLLELVERARPRRGRARAAEPARRPRPAGGGLVRVPGAATGSVLDGVDLELAPGRDGRARRPERERQEHDRRRSCSASPSRRRAACRRRRSTSPAATRRPGGRRSRGCRSARRSSAAPSPRTSGSATPSPTTERVRAAAALAGADAFVRELPDGYETVVGDGGRPLSAGQLQRLALARAFLRDAPLVILDEPTAHLDPESAELVGAAVERLRAGPDRAPHRAPARARAAGRPGRHARGREDRRARCGGGGVSATLRRLVALARRAGWRVALSLLLGALAVGFGVALMTTAGYLISRAAEQPPILSLTVTIVAVRFLGLARPLARYLDRLASHDLALRALARIRVPLLPSASSRSRRRSSRATAAATCSPAWSATSTRSRASTCAASGRRSSRLVVGRRERRRRGRVPARGGGRSSPPGSCSPASPFPRSPGRWAAPPAVARAPPGAS